MMKRFLFSLFAAVCAVALFAGCAEKTPPSPEPDETVKITFVQAGQEDVTRELKKGETLTDIPAPTPRTGYTVAWDRSDFSALTEDITVTAVETANRYTVSLDAGDGTVEPDSVQVTYDASYTLPTPTPANDSYTFTAWMRGETAVASTGTWKIAENVSLTAAWTPNVVETVVVTFVQTGYTNVTREVTKGSALTDIPQPHEKTGYTVVWDRTDFSSITENITVTAVETPNEYTITYDLNGVEADIQSETMTVTYDAPYNLYTPDCEEQIFLYWVIDGTQEKFTNGTWNRTESITLRAVWKLNESEWTEFY